MSEDRVSRRRVLQVLGVAPIAAAVAGAQQAPRTPHTTPNQPAGATSAPARAPQQRRFFTVREWRTVSVLADDVIPRDERSGSATDAGVPAYIDFHMSVPETSDDARVAMRGGLRWLDTESRKRFGVPYASAREAQRHQILDDIAYPSRAKPEFSNGVAFFSNFRNMCASGFFSSAIGHKDLQYMGNTFVPEWNGCPDAALKKLGVSYDLMERKAQ